MPDPVLLEWRGAAAVVTLNRPEQANVLDGPCGEALGRIALQLAQAGSTGQLRAVLIRSTGAHFCAGGDIRGFVAAGDNIAQLLDAGIPPLHHAIHTLATLPVPVISAVQGSVGGGGIGMALCADIVLAGESMKLRGGYSAIGLTPDVGVSWFLTRLAGPMRAKQILWTNQPLNARQCLDAGLVAEVHPDAELAAAADRLLAQVAQGASGSQARIKRLVNSALDNNLHQQMAQEHLAMVASGGSADANEGVRAFVEKRAPRFGKGS